MVLIIMNSIDFPVATTATVVSILFGRNVVAHITKRIKTFAAAHTLVEPLFVAARFWIDALLIGSGIDLATEELHEYCIV